MLRTRTRSIKPAEIKDVKISLEKESQKGEEFDNFFNLGSKSISHSRIHRENKGPVSEVKIQVTTYERLQRVAPLAARFREALEGKGSAKRHQGSQAGPRARRRKRVSRGVAFRDRSALDEERGQQNYPGEKPFICKECGKAFGQSANLSCTKESTQGRNLSYVMNAENASDRGHTSYDIRGSTLMRNPMNAKNVGRPSARAQIS